MLDNMIVLSGPMESLHGRGCTSLLHNSRESVASSDIRLERLANTARQLIRPVS